jgi:anti-sigma regulatory factor (Ser/Thr protein kinase)
VTDERSFAGKAVSVSDARRYVRSELVGEDPDLIEAATLLVSELATNAVRHANSAFVVRMSRTDDTIRFEVSDSGAGEPRIADADPRRRSGRGLQIVQGMSREWGVIREELGKTVWFVLHRPSRSRRRSRRSTRGYMHA